MAINLEFGKYTDYSISESRVSRMFQADEKNATQISLWEKFKDLFRTDKKSDAYNELYRLLHKTDGYDKLDLFNQLREFAKKEHKHLFTKDVYCNDVIFCINNHPVAQSSTQELIGVSEQAPLQNMSRAEQKLFLEMLDTFHEKKLLSSQLSSSQIKDLMYKQYYCDLLRLYRPQDDVETEEYKPKIPEWIMPDVINEKEQHLLCDLNPGAINPSHMFPFMGYEITSSGVEFTMMHPLIGCFLHAYTKPDTNSLSYFESNDMELFNNSYDKYNANKSEYDKVLRKVYDAHGETLNISCLGVNNNKLAHYSNYESQLSDFFSELHNDLSNIFDKWTSSDDYIS